MLTRFISDQSYDTMNVEYPFDENLDIKNIQLNVDGNLNYNIIPSFKNTKDIKTNNYTVTILSRNDNLSGFLDYKNELLDGQNELSYIYSNSTPSFNNNAIFWKIDGENVKVNGSFNDLGRKNIFQVDFLDDEKCKIYHERNNLKYVLAYSLALSSVKMVCLTATNIDNYSTELNYVLEENGIVFYVQSKIGNYAIKKKNSDLLMTYVSAFSNDNNFYIKRKQEVDGIANINNWVSYNDTFNQNNLEVSKTRSHFDIRNNQLFTATINSIVSSLPVNVMTLKNQLNQENDQSRGNVFLGENETNLKEYESIFTGGYRNQGYDKINLGYTVYTTPFLFKSGKTTYFHVPHDIYPYEKLNVNSSKLAESGAVGGNCPLNGDKIWKKLKDYRNTSPYSNPSEENTGQWLCTWLSAGNPNTRPIWVDRYYKPSKTTPYVALSAVATEIIYKDSFDCLDLKEDVSDVKSSLTFEKGCYYAYMHLGQNDYENLIVESLSSKILHTNLDSYKKTNFLNLENRTGEYVFDGKTFGYIESNKRFDQNIATFSFFLEKEDWEIPSGNMIFGNYVNNGFGFYNYILTTPYNIVKKDNKTISILNNNFKDIDTLSTENITLCSIVGIARRNGFENIHAITEDFRLIELSLNGTIVDSNSAIGSALSLKLTDDIFSITNDENHCYVATSSGIAAIDLNTNNVSVAMEKASIDSGSSFELLVDSNQNIYKVYGKQSVIRNTNIYYLSSNEIKTYSTTLSSISSLITLNGEIDCFGVTKDEKIDIISNNNFYQYEEDVLKIAFTLPLSTYSLSVKQISYCEKFEYGELRKFKNIFCQNSNESYVVQLDEKYNQTFIKLNEKYDFIQSNLDISNYNHNIQCLSATYNETNYHFKARLLNKINVEDFTDIIFIVKAEDLATGYRHFVFSIDCYNGVAKFYLDGRLYETINFEPRKYILSSTFSERIYYGANGYFNGIPAFQYMKDQSDFTCSKMKLKENFIINKFLNEFEALYFYSKINPPNDLVYNMPSGTRSFIDSMEKMFDFNIPMYKSGSFKLNILNSGIVDDDIQKDMEEYISTRINEFLPFYGKLLGFDWINTVAKPLVLEGDYNVSNSLTNIR
jgi:hypothetical protein